ncbi:RNA-binding transcriptional accessory protein [Pararhizobium sp. BT-229]|uniref:Tex family protein n=1 Tax=Pararhizobium sp. BT-229 TaxID=2986923 RepID=UPI0021F7EC44|nr:Tex family protein [Pararhizobium sp. BT-229]MCV9964073.1 RNA-binding transcriptional accessory protein [Pararhizobium sp. BT-229]
MQSNAEATIPVIIAAEIGCRADQVKAAIALVDEGATIPFIARYRKEATDGLDDTQLRKLDERLAYLRDFAKRRESVLKAIADQGKLTPEIADRISKAATKAELDDIHAPFRTKIKTRAQTAIENGLLPLADAILASPKLDPEALADAYIGEKVADRKAALDGARDILSERFASHPDTPAKIRAAVKPTARLKAKVVDGKQAEGEKFADYFDHSEALAKAPGHRVLAMLRGAEAGVLTFDVEIEEGSAVQARSIIATDNGVAGAGAFLTKVVDWSWRVKFANRMISEMTAEARERAEAEAIEVFVKNMKALLLAAPAGMKTTMGLDPGIRTGVKVAVVDATGKLLETDTIYPFAPRNDIRGSIAALSSLVRRHGVELISIGNGTASRETDALVGELLKNLTGNRPVKVVVNEAGASVYSASELAAREFPDLDVSLRGAVSIARRLQDPLAELVKIDPKSIGVGQYQHDVDQTRLAKALAGAVEDAVNAVGVDLNTASPALLSYVAGVGPSLADSIVRYRDANGAFPSRADLAKVPRLGEKAFAQCAGFLRVNGGTEPLDASAVHPEAYDVARRIVKACGRDLRQIMGDEKSLKGVKPEQFISAEFGLPTVCDIIEELKKPGRDPRPGFKTAILKEGVNEIKDLRHGMKLEGTVTNVTAFGAFVDIGVHQDGLVHVSQLSDSFVKDPSEVVSAGKIVKVTVTSVDVNAKRIGLSMKSNPEIGDTRGQRGGVTKDRPPQRQMSAHPQKVGSGNGALAEALARAMRK